MASRLSPSCFLHGCGPTSSTVVLLPPFPSSYKPGHFAMLTGINMKKKKKKTVVRAISPEKLEVVKSMEGWMEENVLTFLKPVESSWQPQDFLPDPSGEGFLDGIKEIRERAAEIPDAYYVCLVGNMITEEALPTYENVLNTFDGTRDETGASMTAWARWTRKWTSEENRHGDVLNKYLYLSGRLNMRQIEKTIQYLIGSGMMIEADNDPYRGFVYTSFQERATFISHGNTARKAKEHGDVLLAKICGLIAADEKRHEMAYTKIVEKLFEVDPEATMLALADMMRKRIKMPARFMFDGQERDIFRHYSSVAQRLGVYTSKDYGDVVEFFVERWTVGDVTGWWGEGRRAQDYVCTLPSRLRKTEERAQERAEKKKTTMVPFGWIFNREVEI